MVNQDRKILIVDDNHVNRILIKAILGSYGYSNTSEANDGEEAIKKVEENEYCLIFMDIQMPVINGIEATKYIREILKKKMPIMAITAYDNIEVEENGFNELIRKPYNFEKIKSVVDRYIK